MATITLTSPDQMKPGTTTYRVDWLLLDFAGSRVSIQVVGDHGETRGFEFVGTDGASVLTLISTGNFSARTLDDAVLRRLVAAGLLTGTVA